MSLLLRSCWMIALSLVTFICVADDNKDSFSPFAAVVIDSSQVVSGGLERGFTSRFLLDSGFEFKHNENILFANVQLQRGADGSAMTGDAQAYSNIDEADFTKLYQLYYEFNFSRGFLRIGQHDANEEFANTLFGGGFINSSMGFSPTIAPLPTYPAPTLTIHGGIALSDQSELAAGLYSSGSATRFNEQFYIAELRTVMNANQLFKIGVWWDTNPIIDTSKQKVANGSHGIYTTLDTAIGDVSWLGGSQAEHFIQLGYTDHQYSEIDFHAGTGLRLTQLFGQAQHSAGIGFTTVRLREQSGELIGWESAMELYWQWMLHEQLILQPDIQFIQHPSGTNEIGDAWVVTLRFEFIAF